MTSQTKLPEKADVLLVNSAGRYSPLLRIAGKQTCLQASQNRAKTLASVMKTWKREGGETKHWQVYCNEEMAKGGGGCKTLGEEEEDMFSLCNKDIGGGGGEYINDCN
jgi:hypothetical protein